MPDPVIVTCAVIGGIVTGNPNQPRTRRDIIDAVLEAAEAGASIAHIHARTESGETSQSAGDYEAIKHAVRNSGCDVLLNFTTGGSPGMGFDERRQSLAATPNLASLNAGSINFGVTGEIYQNPKWYIDELAAEMHDRGIVPEYECFDVGMVVTVERAERVRLFKWCAYRAGRFVVRCGWTPGSDSPAGG